MASAEAMKTSQPQGKRLALLIGSTDDVGVMLSVQPNAQAQAGRGLALWPLFIDVATKQQGFGNPTFKKDYRRKHDPKNKDTVLR